MEIEEMQENIRQLLAGQIRILAILENDDKIGKVGLTHEVAMIKKQVLKLVVTYRVRTTLWGVTGGLIVGIIMWFMNKFS